MVGGNRLCETASRRKSSGVTGMMRSYRTNEIRMLALMVKAEYLRQDWFRGSAQAPKHEAWAK